MMGWQVTDVSPLSPEPRYTLLEPLTHKWRIFDSPPSLYFMAYDMTILVEHFDWPDIKTLMVGNLLRNIIFPLIPIATKFKGIVDVQLPGSKDFIRGRVFQYTVHKGDAALEYSIEVYFIESDSKRKQFRFHGVRIPLKVLEMALTGNTISSLH
jgi:hypothetical protein